MVLALEDIVIAAVVVVRVSVAGLDDEPFPEFEHLFIKLFGLEEFVRQRDKVEVEEGFDRRLFESGGFREAVPESVQVGREGRAEVGEWSGADVVSDDEQEERLVLRAVCEVGSVADGWPAISQSTLGHLAAAENSRSGVVFLLCGEEEAEVDLEDGLEEAHVGALVESDLVFPDVDDQDFSDGHGKEGRFAFKVLVLASLAAVGAFDVHDEDVGIARFRHPDALCGLTAFGFRHDVEAGAKQFVEEGTLAGGLGPEYGDDVIVESSVGEVPASHVLVERGGEVLVLVDCGGAIARFAGGREGTWVSCLQSGRERVG